jgi:hypothetical protein
MNKLVNGCKNPLLLKWQKKVFEYDQVHTCMMHHTYFESILDYVHDAMHLYGFNVEEYLHDSEHFIFEFEYDKNNDMCAYLFTNCGYALLVIKPQDEGIRDVFGDELFGIIKLNDLWGYMDTLPNLKKRILPLNRGLDLL